MKYRLRKSIKCNHSCRNTFKVGYIFVEEYKTANAAYRAAEDANHEYEHKFDNCGCRVEVIEV